MSDMVNVVLNPGNPQMSLLTPLFANRVRNYADEYQPEVDGEQFERGIMARLWAGDASVLAILTLDPESQMPVGHLLAEICQFGTQRWVQIHQVKADQDVGNARMSAVEMAMAWGKLFQVPSVFMATHREGKEWQKKLGFKLVRHILHVPLSPSNPALESTPDSSPVV